MEHPSRLNADLAYEVDDVPVLRFVRDYGIPILVWLVMMKFLCGQVVIPLFTSGMLTEMRRKPAEAEEEGEGGMAAEAGGGDNEEGADDADGLGEAPLEVAVESKKDQ